MTGPHHHLANDALTGMACLAALLGGQGNLPDDSDDLMSRVLGADLQGATLRVVLYGAIAAAIVATIVVLAT